MSRVLDYLKPRLQEIVGLLRVLVECESPTDNKEVIDKLAELMAEKLRAIGAEVETLPQSSAGNHVRAEWDLRAPADRPPNRKDGQILLLAHIDTVWPMGQIASNPFRIEEGKAHGPAVLDMKGGIALGYYAIKTLRDLGLGTKLRIVFLLNSDEETQSRSSRDIIEAEARKSNYVFCLEPGGGDKGSIKTFRKGVGTFTLDITGKASHAGNDPEQGISAIQELANQVTKLHSLTDFAKGTTVNVGVVSGGSRPNVIAANATAQVDLRVSSQEEGERVTRAIHALKPTVPGASVKVTGGVDRPVMVRTSQIVALFERARSIASQLGLELDEASVGGGSDANFAAALGIPTIDGLGAAGEGPHALSEYVVLESLPARAALIAELLQILD